ncbi:helix-turn-helix transcriptional regulator [Nocardioides sp. NPDC057767]|uniref:helix-turn-helix transcriptional regulator n=1 Tax=unclassified Nocardioides TaxID=2615069 RepID=UPI0036705F13
MTQPSHEIALGEFLRSRRHRVDPEQAALPSYRRRRVPGLRREEVALLAGVSTSYYTRIEQGTASGVSAGILEAIARTLRLDDEEIAQMYRLAQLAPPRDLREPGALAPELDLLLRSLTTVPVGVLDSALQVLGWNRLGHLVFGSHVAYEAPWSPPGLNWARELFLEERVRCLFRDWNMVALDAVGRMRAAASLGPTAPALTRTVADLCAASAEFAEMWAAHPVRERPLGLVILDHPTLGELHITDSVLRPGDRDDQAAFVFYPAPGSDTERVLAKACGKQ